MGGRERAVSFHPGATTGCPKLVRHSHRNEVSQAWGVTLMFQSQPQSAILCGLPLFHVGGALTQGLAPLSSGQRRSEEHTSELQSLAYLVCRLLLEKKKKKY